jgi:hypothetical protein
MFPSNGWWCGERQVGPGEGLDDDEQEFVRLDDGRDRDGPRWVNTRNFSFGPGL